MSLKKFLHAGVKGEVGRDGVKEYKRNGQVIKKTHRQEIYRRENNGKKIYRNHTENLYDIDF